MEENRCIVIPAFHLPEYLKLCLNCIRLHTSDYKLIVVNDGEDKVVNSVLESHRKYEKELQVISNPKPVGLCKSVNQGVEAADSEFITVLSPEVLVTRGWLEGMYLMFQRFKGVGMTSVMYSSASGLQDAAKTDWFARAPFFTNNVVFGCILFKKKDFEEVGKMDENFPFGGTFADNDLSLRYVLKGWRNIVAPILVLRFPMLPFEEGLIKYKQDFETGKKYFNEKWKDEVQVQQMLGEELPRQM